MSHLVLQPLYTLLQSLVLLHQAFDLIQTTGIKSSNVSINAATDPQGLFLPTSLLALSKLVNS